MTKDDIAHLAGSVGMVQTGSDLLKPMWLASEEQIHKMLDVVIKDVKQSASEVMVKAIKKAAEYERGECAKIAEIAGMTGKDIARSIREREND